MFLKFFETYYRLLEENNPILKNYSFCLKKKKWHQFRRVSPSNHANTQLKSCVIACAPVSNKTFFFFFQNKVNDLKKNLVISSYEEVCVQHFCIFLIKRFLIKRRQSRDFWLRRDKGSHALPIRLAMMESITSSAPPAMDITRMSLYSLLTGTCKANLFGLSNIKFYVL